MTAAIADTIIHPDPEEGIRFERPPGLSWRDYLIMLLHIASGVEHALMVQYLYAAYSLGGRNPTPKQAEMIARWQRSILNIAREEMGHLLTVQNILALLGAPPNFNRGETPFDAAVSPIPFVLAPLTREVAASFTYAEMSPECHDAEHKESIELITEETLKLARSLGQKKIRPEPVGILYREIIKVIGDEACIPDSDLHELSYETQASWDDWGRGYAPDPNLLTPTGDVKQYALHHHASVLVMRAATRTDALAALHAISSQGEAEHLKHPHRIRLNAAHEPEKADPQKTMTEGPGEPKPEPSHFERFLRIWTEHRQTRWRPYINVVQNPSTRPSASPHRHLIHDPVVLNWARLFNTRYRMLLTFLSHSYRLSRQSRPGEPNLRGMVMHRAFGEMYHIKALSGLMVQMKIGRHDGEDLFAGPPFETPYSLDMPAIDADCWRLHRDLIVGARELIHDLRKARSPLGKDYLQTLHELDVQAEAWIDGILRAAEPGKRA
jgi:hypothetical protein